jgi:hypothetical protein
MNDEAGASSPSLCGGVPARVPDPPQLPDPPFYKRWWTWWLGKSVIIAGKQNRILSWMAFYVGLGPVALWLRWTGQDRIDRVVRPIGESGWNTREQPIATDPDRIRRPV